MKRCVINIVNRSQSFKQQTKSVTLDDVSKARNKKCHIR